MPNQNRTQGGRFGSVGASPHQPTIPSCHPDRKHNSHGLCQSCYNSQWSDANPGKRRLVRARSRNNFHGLSQQEWEIGINGPCEICGTRSERMAQDHDHVTLRHRGFLCWKCNAGIGMLGDNPTVIAEAAEYVRTRRDP